MAFMAFPLFLDLTGRRCAVVGMGVEADRKAELLRRAGAVVSRSTAFDPDLHCNVTILIVVGLSTDLAAKASAAAQAHGVLVNVVDQPSLCGFTMPAVVERAPVVIAISTSGVAPVLAKALRIALDRVLPARLGDLAALVGRFRKLVCRRIENANARWQFWCRVFTGEVAREIALGRPAERALLEELDRFAYKTETRDAA